MKRIFYLFLILLLNIPVQATTGDSLKAIDNYNNAYNELKSMLEGQTTLNFERAIFTIENAYWGNKLSYELFQKVLNGHIRNIQQLMEVNDRSDSIDFSVKLDPNKPLDLSKIEYTESEKKEHYRQVLANWAIYTYMTDTLWIGDRMHLPFSYNINDPFGIHDWRNSQVQYLLTSKRKEGNCFALTSLFKILSDRLNSGAEINIAPGHIYIQHKDHKGDWYNVELASRSHPSDGSIQTLTYTYLKAIQNGIALRRLNLKQDIALCLVYLAKSYEYKFSDKSADFLMQCAELALEYDNKNLNALLLKHQVLSERVIDYITQNKIEKIDDLREFQPFLALEKQTLLLFNLGYHEMPVEMQEMILAGLKREDNQPIFVEDRTPNPFTSIEVDSKDSRYATLSGGLFEELHAIKKYETYGYFVLDTEEGKIVKVDSRKQNEMLIDPVAFAWQIDPLAHEFPSWSPYAIVKNNPIYYIDPTGMAPDDYKLDEQGNISLLRKTDDDFDVLYNENETNSIKVDKGILGDSRTNTVTANNKEYTFDEYDITGDDKAKELFEFTSTNSDVEWSLTGVGDKNGDKGKNILTTSHKETSEIGGGYLLSKDYTIRKHTHSHPYHSFPSTSDKSFAKAVNIKFPKATLDIFHKGSYYKYDKAGLLTLPKVNLPEIDITVPKTK